MRDDTFEEHLGARLGSHIKRAERALMVEKANALRQLELTVPQYSAVLSLYYSPAQSAAQLARRANVAPQTMAMILSNLEGKRLIERRPSSVHGKVLVTTLTPEGNAIALRADEVAGEVEDRLSAALSDEEVRVFRALLVRAADAFRTQKNPEQ